MKMETDEDFEELVELARRVLDFFAENALEHERIGECMDRIGLPVFLEAIGIDPDPNMVNHPRTSCYVRTDDFTGRTRPRGIFRTQSARSGSQRRLAD